tara:strand:+ start:1803 stop:1997 length:195 start_codon:yes stop_codon:yes gene_type:complete
MSKITFRGYRINLRFVKSSDSWQLELEKGDYIKTLRVGLNLTLSSIEDLAFKEIDKLILEETKA